MGHRESYVGLETDARFWYILQHSRPQIKALLLNLGQRVEADVHKHKKKKCASSTDRALTHSHAHAQAGTRAPARTDLTCC